MPLSATSRLSETDSSHPAKQLEKKLDGRGESDVPAGNDATSALGSNTNLSRREEKAPARDNNESSVVSGKPQPCSFDTCLAYVKRCALAVTDSEHPNEVDNKA